MTQTRRSPDLALLFDFTLSLLAYDLQPREKPTQVNLSSLVFSPPLFRFLSFSLVSFNCFRAWSPFVRSIADFLPASPLDQSPHYHQFLSLSFHRSFPSSRGTTVKVSSLLIPRARAITFPPEVEMASQRLNPNSNMSQSKSGRRRRSSSIIYQEPAESLEHTSDQAALPNLNANWVNAKGECLPSREGGWK